MKPKKAKGDIAVIIVSAILGFMVSAGILSYFLFTGLMHNISYSFLEYLYTIVGTVLLFFIFSFIFGGILEYFRTIFKFAKLKGFSGALFIFISLIIIILSGAGGKSILSHWHYNWVSQLIGSAGFALIGAILYYIIIRKIFFKKDQLL
jgi:hypothetical protein